MKGFTYIEFVLLSLFLSIFILQISKIHLVNLKNNTSLYNREIALIIAENAINRIKLFDISDSNFSYLYLKKSSWQRPSLFSCVNKYCSPKQMMLYNINYLKKEVENNLFLGKIWLEKCKKNMFCLYISWAQNNYTCQNKKTCLQISFF